MSVNFHPDLFGEEYQILFPLSVWAPVLPNAILTFTTCIAAAFRDPFLVCAVPSSLGEIEIFAICQRSSHLSEKGVLSWEPKVPPQCYPPPQEIAGPNSRPY